MSSDVCEIKPVQAFLSTNLNNKNKTFKDLTDRILRQLGFPSSTVELHRDQIYDAISIAIEFYTKYAGYDESYLVFDSRIYEHNKGIRIDKLCTIATDQAYLDVGMQHHNSDSSQYDKVIEIPERNYVAIRDIPIEELPSSYFEPIKNLDIFTSKQYDEIVSYNAALCSFFRISQEQKLSIEGELSREEVKSYHQAYDYDLMDYRRVMEVISYSESSNKSLTSLFTFESALASQAYYTYQFSTRGFDLLTFHTLQEFLKTRRRVLALDRSFYFDNRTQYFTLSPQPKLNHGFFGVIQVKLEAPIRNVIDRIWVFKYALAQCKVILGGIRGRHGSVALAGGGVMADSLNLRAEGIKEMEVLEKELTEGSAFSEKTPAVFFVG